MPSSLLRKLNAMRAGESAPAQARPKALIERVCRQTADARLFALSPTALRRIGYNGHAFHIERTLFLDTETTGLSGGAGTVAFLVGIGCVDAGDFVVRQYLMSDYAQEALMLETLAEKMRAYDTVVHFNGRAFDMPLLESRFTLSRMRGQWKELNQLDLLLPARRLWKLRLGSCKLSNLEARILGAARGSDIPGAEIPQRYFEYLKCGDLNLLEDIIAHNRQDIFTLSALLCALADAYREPERAQNQMDIFSLGKALEKQGEWDEARKLYHIAAMPRPQIALADLIGEKYAGQANLRLFHMYRRSGLYARAEETLKNMIRRGQMGFIPQLELAKLYEHRMKRPKDALLLVRGMLEKCPEAEKEALFKREERLARRTQNEEKPKE